MKIVWLHLAQQDLGKIDNYLTQAVSKAVASRQIVKIVKAVWLLHEQPYLWHISSNDPEVLEWHIPNTTYTLPYMVQVGQVIILRVFDERQDKPSQWLIW